jgi:deazaflavin-dependent oxidoreductase (nitroreductase family)
MPLPRALGRFNVRVTNPVLGRVVQRLPGFGHLEHLGRRTGRRHRTPVLAFRHDDRITIAATYGADSDWVRNVVAAGGGWFVRGHRRWRLTEPRVYRDPRRRGVPWFVRVPLSLIRAADFFEARIAPDRDTGSPRGPSSLPYTPGMRPTDRRHLVILTEGQWGDHHAKTAYGVIRYGQDDIVAVLDSTRAGENVEAYLPGHDIPIVATLADALALPTPPDALLIGIAPTGGRLPDSWRTTILAAIEAGLDVLSGLHTFIGDDPEFAAAAAAKGTAIIDYRRPPERMETAVGRRHLPGKRVILTVATDCAIGKMSVALELRKSGQAAGDPVVFVPTGQTGMMIEGWGVAVDRLISDFTQGTVEWMVEQGEAMGDWILVEGQGSIDHPAYSSVTVGLIHGATPHAMVMTYKAGQSVHDFDHLPDVSFPIAPLPEFIAMHERLAALVAPSKVVAVAVNTSLIRDPDEARRAIAEVAELTGLPADDPVRFGADRFWPQVRDAVDALPWVRGA